MQGLLYPHSKIVEKTSLTSGTRRDGKRILRSDGRALRRIRRPVRLRSRALGTRTTREGLPQWPGQSPRVSQVLLPEDASAVVHLRKRNASR